MRSSGSGDGAFLFINPGKEINMKKRLAIISILLGASTVWAAQFTDDFNRADQGLTSNGSLLGATWVSSGGGSGIEDGRLFQK
jgi:hypothetical protein